MLSLVQIIYILNIDVNILLFQSRLREEEAKNLPPLNRDQLLEALIEMQKRSDYKAGLRHVSNQVIYLLLDI